MFADQVDDEYDYIVVGSGAGGGPVAANLAKAGYRVLVLEAGGADEPDEYRVPAFHVFSAEHDDLAWKFFIRHYGETARQHRVSAKAEPSIARQVRAKHEVILAGGAFNTPQLLMLSGIGPRKHLDAIGIKTNVELSGVGKNLQDRYEIGVVHRMREDHQLLRNVAFRRYDPEFAEWRTGHGLYATNGVLLAIIKRSSLDQPDPDLFLFAIPGEFSGYVPGYAERGRKKDYLTWAILKAHTRNTAGEVRLRSADPREAPDINFHYFDEGTDQGNDDLDSVVAGIEFVRKIARRTAGVLDEELPGAHVRSRAELAQFVKDNAWGHHACGTCKIGADGDTDAVLDGAFRVRGVKALCVVDASIFPRIPGFFILSAIYMAAEKASDAILADAKHPA